MGNHKRGHHIEAPRSSREPMIVYLVSCERGGKEVNNNNNNNNKVRTSKQGQKQHNYRGGKKAIDTELNARKPSDLGKKWVDHNARRQGTKGR